MHTCVVKYTYSPYAQNIALQAVMNGMLIKKDGEAI